MEPVKNCLFGMKSCRDVAHTAVLPSGDRSSTTGTVCLMGGWKKPGLYAVAAAVVGAVATSVSSWELEKRRDVERRGAQTLPPGGVIVIANHTSLADGVFLALVGQRLGRPLRLLGTAGIIDAPVLKRLFKHLGFIAVHRSSSNPASALEPAAEALRAGEAIALYPEGRITRNSKQWPERAKTGAVRLALLTGAPIVPVASVGIDQVMGRRKHKMLFQLIKNLVKRPRVRIQVGDPIDVRKIIGIGPTTEATIDEVRLATDEVSRRLIGMLETMRGEQAPDAIGVERLEH
jgi:1-acyl-sn-glycerol-3-phosphate acyltransferase